MSDYLFLIKSRNEESLSTADLEGRMQRYNAWREEHPGVVVDGQRLEKVGAQVNLNKEVITDGPFLEAKEMIAGFVQIKAESLEVAIALAQSCPLLDHHDIEVRPIAG